MALPHLHVPHDVLSHHDRIVDEDADGERQTEQRHRVQREAEGPHRDERRQHRDRKREARDDRGAPGVEEQEHDNDRQPRTLDEGFLHAEHRVLDAHTRVLHDPQGHTRGERLLELRDPLADRVAHRRRAEARGLEDVDADGHLVVVMRRGARFLGRVAHVGQVAEPHDTALRLRDGELLEIGRRVEPALQADGALVQLPFEAADGRRQVLRLQRLHDLPDADPRRLEVARTDLDDQLALDRAGQVHGRHAGDAAQLARDAGVRDARQLGAGQAR